MFLRSLQFLSRRHSVYNDNVPRLLLIAILLCIGMPACFGQGTTAAREKLLSETVKRVAELNEEFPGIWALTPEDKELRAACAVNCGTPALQAALHDAFAKHMAAADQVISEIYSELDAYVTKVADPKREDLNCKMVQDDLQQILGSRPAYGDVPSPFVLNSPNSPSLIVVYNLHKGSQMGPGSSLVTLRTYKVTSEGVKLGDIWVTDMDGYGEIVTEELPSPVPGEKWLLVRGRMTGANGPNNGMRVYAYDGGKFRILWTPKNIWGSFKVTVTSNGFTVDGQFYRENRELHETYFVLPDGIYAQQ